MEINHQRITNSTAIVSDPEPTQHHTEDDDHDDMSTDSSSSCSTKKIRHGDPDVDESAAGELLLYDAQIDEEDEAYVYKNMRGGCEEAVQVQCVNKLSSANRSSSSNDYLDLNLSDKTNHLRTTMNVLKPRDSDATLSCPCCLNVVCMDCQKHETIRNQYRAMFVMNIGVHWDKRYIYNEDTQVLVEFIPLSSIENLNSKADVVREDVDMDEKELYYSVYCLNCSTEVAYLDMNDELYHFSGCVASQG